MYSYRSEDIYASIVFCSLVKAGRRAMDLLTIINVGVKSEII